MITLRELFGVAHTITRVDITAKADGLRFLHRFWIGKNCDRGHLPKGMIQEWAKDRLSLSDRRINAHGKSNKKGLPEMGWGLEDGAIPDELLDAEIIHLGMHCANGIEYTVNIEVILPEMTVEMLKAGFDDGGDGDG